ncbi:MAG: VCBS repeat-containing protein [Planctomycetota bacterium]
MRRIVISVAFGFALTVLLWAPHGAAQQAAGSPRAVPPPLAYVESSSGLGNPAWEGGHTELEMGDVNGDGLADIVTIGDHGSPYVGTNEHGIMVYFGNGTGAGWSVYMNGNFGYGGIALGDVNDDGLADVGYGMHHANSSTDFGNQLIEVALGDGTGRNWTPWDDGLATHGESWGMFGTDFADVDGDGDLDLVSISFGAGAGLHVYLNDGDGTWTHSFGFLNGNSSLVVCFGDVNGDGWPDIAAGHEYGTVWLGDGLGGFVNADGSLPSSSLGLLGVDLDDVNGDGFQDISLCTIGGSIQVWLWNGSNDWVSFSDGLPGSSTYQYTQLSDLDGDGSVDLAAFADRTVKVWMLDETQTWQAVTSFQTGSPGYPQAFRSGVDVDYNGRADIVLLSDEGSWPSDHNYLRFYREASVPTQPAIRFVYPRGNEVLRRGAVVFVDWISTVPGGFGGASRVRLELSTSGRGGPWIPLALDLANGGRYQWRIPGGLPASSECLLRLRMTSPAGAAWAVTPQPFRLQ